jgi:uroporphyrinogen-III synthase
MSERHPVVITRPLAQGRPLAERVQALGREAIVFPLLEIFPLLDDYALRAALSQLDDYALVAFVSPNAIDAAFRLVQFWPAAVALGVMGEGSRQALAMHGVDSSTHTIFSPLDPDRTDSQTLLEALDLESLRGRKVLIVRGESGRELLADAMRTHGIEVEQVPAYRRAAPQLDAPRRQLLADLLAHDSDWLITSSEALHILLDQVSQVSGTSGVAKMQQQALIVPHVRIAETARQLGFTRVRLTASGDEALLSALQSRA